MKKIITIYLLLIFATLNVFSQKENKHIRSGNRFYSKKKYSQAEAEYRKALDIDSTSFVAMYNYAEAQYKQKNYTQAKNHFDELKLKTQNKDTLSKVFYNAAMCWVKLAEDTLTKSSAMPQMQRQSPVEPAIKNLETALDNFKTSIKLNPNDKKAKYNYLYVEKVIEKLKEQQQQQQQNQNQNQDQNKDQDKQNQDNNDKNQQNKQKDTDKDGIPDDVEKPQNPDNKGNNDLDKDGIPDNKDEDSDNDGNPDYNDTDSDNDGIPDSQEAGENPNQPKDTDNDGVPDYKDTDSDNDGVPDSEEKANMYKIPYDEMMRILNAVKEGDQNTYEEAQKKLQNNVKSKKNNW